MPVVSGCARHDDSEMRRRCPIAPCLAMKKSVARCVQQSPEEAMGGREATPADRAARARGEWTGKIAARGRRSPTSRSARNDGRSHRGATLHGQCQRPPRVPPPDAHDDAVRGLAAGAPFRPCHTAPRVRDGRADRGFRGRVARWRDAHGPWHSPRAIGTQSRMRRPVFPYPARDAAGATPPRAARRGAPARRRAARGGRSRPRWHRSGRAPDRRRRARVPRRLARPARCAARE